MFEIDVGGADDGFATIGSSGVTKMGETTMKNRMATMEKMIDTVSRI